MLALSMLWSGPAFAWTAETRVSGLKVASTPAEARWGELSVPATFSIECYPGEDGSFSLALEVAGIEAFADFPYFDFEGPDAPMNERDLYRVVAGDIDLMLSQGGWFSTPTAFTFAHNDIPAGDGPVRAVVNALLSGAAPLTVSIIHPDDPDRAIVATVPLDGALPVLATATDGCR